MAKDIEKIIELLENEIDRISVVHSTDPFKVLISTVLSQRTRDENTAKATEKLFSVYKTPEEISNADEKDLQRLIKSSGFYRTKAERIKEISQKLLEKFNGKVPDNLNELLSLPGVGRKTANCVLVYAYQKPAIPVDTHVHRISNRLGLVRTKTPEETENELAKIIPKKHWIVLNHSIVRFGQKLCLPRNPKCEICLISQYCDYYSASGMKYKSD